MSYDICGVPVNLIDSVWEHASHFVKLALDKTEGEIGLDDIHKDLSNRDMQLWMLFDNSKAIGAIITQIMNYPKMKACRIVAMGGDVNGHFDNIDEILTGWAIEHECDRLEIVGRKGWTRAIRHLGYGEAYSYVTKPLRD